MVRIGIIGLGFMGRMHITAYQHIPDAQIVAISARDPKRVSGDLSGGWSNIPGAVEHLDMAGVTGTTDYRELFAMEQVDVVDICSPTPLHESMCLEALEAGKHVICEKPLALSSASAQRIADAAAEAKAFFMPAMCMRFWPQWAWIKQVVEEGRYGRVRAATFRRLASMPPGWFSDAGQSGGALLDLHIHDTDFVYHLFGMPRRVHSRGYSQTTRGVDHVATQYLYGEGQGPELVTAEGGWCMAPGFNFTMSCLLSFEQATVDFDVARQPALQVSRAGEVEPVELPGDGYSAELAYFVQCVQEGRPPRTVTAADAVASIRIAEAEGRSVTEQRAVDL